MLFAAHKGQEANTLAPDLYLSNQYLNKTKSGKKNKCKHNCAALRYNIWCPHSSPLALRQREVWWTNLKIKSLISTAQIPQKSSDALGLANGICDCCLHTITFFEEKYRKYVFARSTHSDFNLADVFLSTAEEFQPHEAYTSPQQQYLQDSLAEVSSSSARA